MANSQMSSQDKERRSRAGFRALIDEMLAQLREASSAHPEWSDEERARAEADLERIMARVRAEAMNDQAAPQPASRPARAGGRLQ